MGAELLEIEQPPVEEIVRRIVGALRPRRIVMFGSRARGDARPDSDIDIMVEMETDERPPDRVFRVLQLFDRRRWAMDVVVYTPEEVRRYRDVFGTLLAEIEEEGKTLYERP